MSAQLASVTPGYDTPSDLPTVESVVEATKHLCAFRAGFAEVVERLAIDATQFLPTAGHALLEPALRILGTERATRMAGRLYRIASDVTGDWYEGAPDRDEAGRTLRAVCVQAAHEVAAEFQRDTRICCVAHRAIDPPAYETAGGIQL